MGGGSNLPPLKPLRKERGIMKKGKKRYVKPTVKKNKKMVNVTFATGPAVPGTPATPGTVTP